MLLARALYSRFARTLAPLSGSDPLLHPSAIPRLTALRVRLLEALGLPATRHNLHRLVLCAMGGLSLTTFIRDVDVFFPVATLADEALFLVSLATHCDQRGATTTRQRRYECEALLDLPHGRHAAAVEAWLAGELDYAALRLHCRQDPVRA